MVSIDKTTHKQPFPFPLLLSTIANHFKQTLNHFLSQKHAQNIVILF